jgi:hypothetical protein
MICRAGSARFARRRCYRPCMSPAVIAIGLFIFLSVVLVGFLLIHNLRHIPERAAASVTVAANVPFELPLTGSPGKLFFHFHIDLNVLREDIASRPKPRVGSFVDESYDLLVSGEIFGDHGGRAFAVRTAERSKIEGASNARKSGNPTAGGNDAMWSIKLATVQTGDYVVRGVVREHPKGKLLKGWVYVPRGRK